MVDKIETFQELVEAVEKLLLTDIRNWYGHGGMRGVMIPNFYFMDKENDNFVIEEYANGKYLLQNKNKPEVIAQNVGELLVITKNPNKILNIIKLIKEATDDNK